MAQPRKRLPRPVRELLKTLEPAMVEAFLTSIKGLRGAALISDLVEAIAADSADEVARLFGLSAAAYGDVDQAIRKSFYGGGKLSIDGLPPLADPAGGKVAIFFDGRSAAAEAWLAEASGNLITGGLLPDQKIAIRETLERGVAVGRHPRATALDLIGRISKVTGKREGGIIGLTSQQRGYAASMADELAAFDNNYFTRTLRDKRYDGTVRKAFKAKEQLPVKTTDTLTGRYRTRLLRLRAETIARTETLTALSAGRYEGVSQLVASGKVRDDQIERTWGATGGPKTREDHADMDGQKVIGLKTPFVAPDGSRLLFPRDSSLGAGADQIINCRCYDDIRIKYLDD